MNGYQAGLRMYTPLRSRWLTLLGGALLAVGSTANAVTIAETPLFISTAVTPNVMLMIDNSGQHGQAPSGPAATIRAPPTPTGAGSTTAARRGPPTTPISITARLVGSSTWRTSGAGIDCPTALAGPRARRRTAPPAASSSPILRARRHHPLDGQLPQLPVQYLRHQQQRDPLDLSTGAIIPNTNRWQVAKYVASNVVTNNTTLRIGLSSFWNNEGGKIDAACGSSTATLQSKITSLAIELYTPLAETFYEITRYFRGDAWLLQRWHLHEPHPVPVPEELRHHDHGRLSDQGHESAGELRRRHCRHHRRGCPTGTAWLRPPPQPSTRTFPSTPTASSRRAPMATRATRCTWTTWPSSATTSISRRPATTSMARASTTSAYPKQNLVTYTIGFAVANQMLQDAATYGHGSYYTATNAAQLTTALATVVADIKARTSTVSSVTSNSTRLTADSLLYQAKFSTTGWARQLLAYPLLSGGALGQLSSGMPAGPDPAQAGVTGTSSPTTRRRLPGPGAGSSSGRRWPAAQQTELNKNTARHGRWQRRGAPRLPARRPDQRGAGRPAVPRPGFTARRHHQLGSDLRGRPELRLQPAAGFRGLQLQVNPAGQSGE